MIRYNLKCRKDHLFEAWFHDSSVYDSQIAAGEVRCPVCGTKKVEKALMAPNIATSKARSAQNKDSEQAAETLRTLRELRRKVEENCDYVGDTFAEEARKIHYGEVEERNIYGETSDDDARALQDEGVSVQRIPWIPNESS